MKYENELWGKVDFLHERYKKKHIYVSNFIEIINKFQNSCLNFSKSLLIIINKNYQLLEEKNNSIYNTIQNLLSFINLQSQEFNELFINIKTSIFEPTTKLLDELNRKEKELFISFAKARTQYNNSKISLEKNQKDFENSTKICEKAICNSKSLDINPLASKEDKNKNLTRANSFINNSKAIEDKYYMSVEEANKMRINEYNKEKELLNFYQNVDKDNYDKIKGMVGVFLVLIKKMYESIFNSIELLSDKYKKIDIINDLNTFIQNNKSDNKPDKEIHFVPYSPEANLKTTSISGDQKETEQLQINYEVISTLRQSFRNICEDLNMEEETRKHRLRLLTLKIFKIGPNVTFSQNEKDELISYLKVPEYRTYFIINLSKQRTKGRFQRGEKLLDDLAEILDFILEISEKEKNYEDAKNCIILSQTFYTEISLDKNKKKEKYKRYLFDYIIDNKWLSSISFWEGIIDYMIQNELKKNEEINKDIILKESLEEKKQRISNVGFSQLLSYTNNMMEFNIKKEVIKNLVDSFVKKYEIEKKLADMIYDNIKNTPENPPKIPIIRKKKTKTKIIMNNKLKKSKSLINKKNVNLNIDFDFIEKKTKNNTSVKKYKTKISLEDNKFKLKRKNELSKKFKKFNFDNKSEILKSSIYNKSDPNSLDLNRKTSYEIENKFYKNKLNNLGLNSAISYDIPNINMNINEINNRKSNTINVIEKENLDEKNNEIILNISNDNKNYDINKDNDNNNILNNYNINNEKNDFQNNNKDLNIINIIEDQTINKNITNKNIINENIINENKINEYSINEKDLNGNNTNGNNINENEIKENKINKNIIIENQIIDNQINDNIKNENIINSNQKDENAINENIIIIHEIQKNEINENKIDKNEMNENKINEEK